MATFVPYSYITNDKMNYKANSPELFIDESIQTTPQDYTSTFAANMTLPIHKWYRYTAGFSALWVNELIAQEKLKGRKHIIDPFAGSGTVLLEAGFNNVDAYGLEAHAYIYKIADTKLSWNISVEELKKGCLKLLETAKKIKLQEREYPKLIVNCFPKEILEKLDRLRQAWLESPQSELIQKYSWFIITSILRITSPVGTAQWQYIQPTKTKAKIIDPYIAFEAKLNEICADIKTTQQKYQTNSKAIILNEDARDIKSIPNAWGDLVITSPPYANNYDYADATRLEMSFWGDISGWTDLQELVRKHLVRACTQHVSGLAKHVDDIFANPKIQPIKEELTGVFDALKIERLSHGGKKNYHFMIAAYFKDLAEVFHSLRRTTREGVKMCFVIGDSAPYGIYVPVDRWLGELAIGAGFKDFSFEKMRDRNVKWKNRKHRVPLKEGRLWING